MMAAQAGQLELNVMMPIIAHNLFESFTVLTNAIYIFAEKCVVGIDANAAVCNRYADTTLGLATVLNPYIGYLNAAEVVKESMSTGKSIKEIVKEKKLLNDEDFARLFDPANLTEPRKI